MPTPFSENLRKKVAAKRAESAEKFSQLTILQQHHVAVTVGLVTASIMDCLANVVDYLEDDKDFLTPDRMKVMELTHAIGEAAARRDSKGFDRLEREILKRCNLGRSSGKGSD